MTYDIVQLSHEQMCSLRSVSFRIISKWKWTSQPPSRRSEFIELCVGRGRRSSRTSHNQNTRQNKLEFYLLSPTRVRRDIAVAAKLKLNVERCC